MTMAKKKAGKTQRGLVMGHLVRSEKHLKDLESLAIRI